MEEEKIRRGWVQNEKGNFVRTFSINNLSIPFTVFPDRDGNGWRYAGGRKFSEKTYKDSFSAMQAAEGAFTGGGRYSLRKRSCQST